MTTAQSKLVKKAIAARKRAEKSEHGASPARWEEADCYAEMAADGWSQRRIAKECGTNQTSVSFFVRAVIRYPISDTRPPFWEAYAEVTGEKTTAEKMVASDQNEWYTPAKYIKAAKKVLGRIDLDPASCPEANKIVKARNIYTSDENGMDQPWFGAVWLNPPYGRLAGQFVQRLVLEYEGEAVESAIALVNSHCTDTDWFQSLWPYPLCFTDHRIDFNSGGREKKTTSTHGSVFAYLGDDVAAFKLNFETFGPIVRRL